MFFLLPNGSSLRISHPALESFSLKHIMDASHIVDA